MGGVNLLTVAAALGAAGVVEAVARSGDTSGAVSPGAVLALCGTLPVILAVRANAAAAVISGSVLLGLVIGEQPTVAALVALAGMLHRAGARGPYRMSVVLIVPFAVYAVAPIASRPGGEPFGAVLLLIAAAALASGGLRRSRAVDADRRAASGAHTEMAYAYATREERARIARELHDIVAHHISLISVQAETARLTVPDMPADGAARLLAIGETARQALTEMRRVLGVLRDDVNPTGCRAPLSLRARDSGARQPLDQSPQPGLDQLIGLVDDDRAAGGSRTRLVVSGASQRLDPGLELTAYRIVQEALTNARRHAPGAAVDIEVGFHPDRLHLHVWNTWGDRRAEPSGEGLGLVGMRERVALAGGTLRTAHSRTGGFVVEAVLPVNGTP
jgi:signal transduction histidine kinase